MKQKSKRRNSTNVSFVRVGVCSKKRGIYDRIIEKIQDFSQI